MRLSLWLVVAIGCANLAAIDHHASARPPNLVFILADDYGTGEVGCYGSDQFKTPALDALAQGGLRFTRAFTAPLCGPSRALLMTGRYAFRTGATNQDATGRMTPTAEPMVPTWLKSAGYVSTAIGKWGQLPANPAEFGFDDYLSFKGSGVYWNSRDKAVSYVVNGKTHKLNDGEYMPDRMHNHLVDFITRNREQPFFAYYSLSHVHGELVPTPDSVSKSPDLLVDNIAYMDRLVGRLVAELERLGLRQQTVVIFMGDNGSPHGSAERATIGGRRVVGGKGSMEEGGGLVPLIVNWPGVTPAGRVSSDLVDGSDLLPTLAELAGASLPTERIFDGHSFAAQIGGEPGRPRSWVFNQLANQYWVRDSAWKLNQAGELFDMRDAPFAETKIADDTTAPQAIEARQRLQAVLASLNPAGGIVDDGDGTGRHASKAKKRTEKKAIKE